VPSLAGSARGWYYDPVLKKIQPLLPCMGPKTHTHRTKGQLFCLSRRSNFALEHGEDCLGMGALYYTGTPWCRPGGTRHNEVCVIVGIGLDPKRHQSHWPARLDLIQSASGLFLGLFMWSHMAFVSSILISKDVMWWVTQRRALEGRQKHRNRCFLSLLAASRLGAEQAGGGNHSLECSGTQGTAHVGDGPVQDRGECSDGCAQGLGRRLSGACTLTGAPARPHSG